jgi:uncharacterized membrane protein YjjB (DUF3815 family)
MEMLANVELVILSFFASLGFGIVFQIRRENLLLAGLAGALIRIVYLIFMAFIPYRIVYVGLAAFCASVYAEVLAIKKRMPATVLLYPAIVPLIPGDLFYYMMVGVVWSDSEMFVQYAWQCLLALTGISVGFVLSSSILHYIRQIRIRKA